MDLCFCGPENISQNIVKYRNFNDNFWSIVASDNKYIGLDLDSEARMQKEDCSQCKHKFICLLDKRADKRFESTV